MAESVKRIDRPLIKPSLAVLLIVHGTCKTAIQGGTKIFLHVKQWVDMNQHLSEIV